MTRRISSLDKTTVGIDRDVSSQYDNVKLVAGSIEDVSAVAGTLDAVVEVYNNLDDIALAVTAPARAEANVVLTHIDVVQAGLDRAATAADVVSTNNDRAQTGLDRIQTGLDVTITNNNKTVVEALFDTFDDRFLGTFTTDPITDNDGNPLLVGAVCYNSNELAVKFYNGSSWDNPKASTAASATTASNAAAAALVSQGIAEDKADLTAADAISTGEDVVTTNADVVATNASKDLAEKWAEEDAYIEVTSGKYSAKHWALQASDLPHSCGMQAAPTYTDHGDGTITIDEGVAYLASTTNFVGGIRAYTIAGVTFPIAENVTSYIVVDYNSGSPAYVNLTNTSTINESNIVPVYTINRYDSVLDVMSWDGLGVGLSNKLHARFVRTERVKRESGLTLTESTGRVVNITEGVVWVGAAANIVSAFTSTNNQMELFHHTAGAWDSTTITQYDNLQYDDGTDLQTLSNNRYTINWVFRNVSTIERVGVVLGSDSYTLVEALDASVPTALPPNILTQGILVGRIIVGKNDAVANLVQGAFTTSFVGGLAAQQHNDLTEIQGGSTGDYQHLTTSQVARLDSVEDGATSTIIRDSLTSTSTEEALSANQGRELNAGKVDNSRVLTDVPIGAVFTDTEKVTSLDINANILTYIDEESVETNIDLNPYLDDTVLTDAEVKIAYENNTDTNAYTDTEKSKLGGIETNATKDQTPTEILTAIKTVDGVGSGLDADLLDGHDSNYFLTTVEDNLTSTSTTNALSANQGKELKTLVDQSAGKTEWEVTQTSHGFSVLDVVYSSGGVWTKAKADNTETMGLGLVNEVIDANTFKASLSGYYEATAHGLTVDEFYYLSDTIAGGLTLTEPANSQPVLYVVDANNVLILPYRPSSTPVSGYSDITTATGVAGSTTVPLTYTLDALLVFCNGVQLGNNSADDVYYEATNGTSVIVHGTLAGDSIRIISFGDFEVADAYTKIQSDGNYATQTDLSSTVQTTSHRKSVIALCELTNVSTSLNSYSSGELVFHRDNSIVPEITCKLQIAKSYNTAKPNAYLEILSDTLQSYPDIKICTFTHNGVKYGGLHFYYGAAMHDTVIAKLTGNFDVFGLDYYDTQNSVVLNTEVNDSLSFTDYNRVQQGHSYNQGNILGTVSQTAGIPTGAIIERGSNDDGEYVKFADGTLICTARATFQNNGTGSANSKVISLPSTMLYLNGAQSFAVTCNVDNATTSYCFPIGNAESAATIRVYLRKYDGSIAPSTAGQLGNYTAIGRWY